MTDAQKAGLLEITLGDADAFAFCAAFYRWVDLVDNLVDRDHEIASSEVGKTCSEVALAFAFNPFFLEHKDSLCPLIVAGAAAWAESEALKKSEDVRLRLASQILKSSYTEVLWHVAYVMGGWEHRIAMATRYREFDFG